jgi:hypothetical protein
MPQRFTSPTSLAWRSRSTTAKVGSWALGPSAAKKTVHLLAPPDQSSGAPALYLTAKAGVFWTPLPKFEPNALNFQQCIAEMASGIVFGANACLYVAGRDNCRIKQYANFAPKPGKGERPNLEWPVIYERKRQKP